MKCLVETFSENDDTLTVRFVVVFVLKIDYLLEAPPKASSSSRRAPPPAVPELPNLPHNLRQLPQRALLQPQEPREVLALRRRRRRLGVVLRLRVVRVRLVGDVAGSDVIG